MTQRQAEPTDGDATCCECRQRRPVMLMMRGGWYLCSSCAVPAEQRMALKTALVEGR